MEPSGIELKHRYDIRLNVAEDTEDNQANWGEQLWKLLSADIVVEMPPVLVDREDYDFIRVRLVNHLLARLVVRSRQAFVDSIDVSEDARLATLTSMVLDTIGLSTEKAARAAWLLDRICIRINRSGAQLTKKQRQSVKNFAALRAHRCYVCGCFLDFDPRPRPANDDDYDFLQLFEVDHLFPQARGGSQATENLSSMCNSCNKHKDVHLSYADLGVEAIITSSLEPTGIAKAFGRRTRFAVLWRQRGVCGICSRGFYDASDERLFLVRRKEDDSYHFMNVYIVCGDCVDNGLIQGGVKLRD